MKTRIERVLVDSSRGAQGIKLIASDFGWSLYLFLKLLFS